MPKGGWNTRKSAALGCALVIALAGCSSGGGAGSSAGESLPATYQGYSVDEMIAAYAPTVEEMRQGATSDFALKVLEDGYVSESEYAEALSRYKKCLTDAGYRDIEFYADGTHSVLATDEQQETLRNAQSGEDDPDYVCAKETGELEAEALYAMMMKNPLNEDPMELIVACLRDRGAVEASFTASNLEQLVDEANENQDMVVPLLESSDWHLCLADPLGIMPSGDTVIGVP